MKNQIREYLYQNRVEYFKAFLVFVIGIVISIMIINKSNNEQKLQIKKYIDDKIELVKVNEYNNQFAVFENALKRNIKNYLLIFLCASSIIGLPIVYFALIKKAFSIGYTVSAIIATQTTRKGIIFICNSILLHNIIYIASIFIVLVAGVSFTKALFNRKNLKLEILKYLIFSLIGFVLIIVSSLCEAYISINFLYLMKKYL